MAFGGAEGGGGGLASVRNIGVSDGGDQTRLRFVVFFFFNIQKYVNRAANLPNGLQQSLGGSVEAGCRPDTEQANVKNKRRDKRWAWSFVSCGQSPSRSGLLPCRL